MALFPALRTAFVAWSYPVIYRCMHLAGRFLPAPSGEGVCLVVAEQNRGWILDRYCHEIASVMDEGSVHYGLDRLPRAGSYYFSHVSLVLAALKRYPHLYRSRLALMHTHLLEDTPNREEIFHVLRRYVDLVTCMNTAEKVRLIEEGVSPDVLEVLIGGVDDRFYRTGTPQTRGRVLICSAYYPRKSPRRLMDIAARASHMQFTVLGPGWSECALYEDMQALPNVTFMDRPFEEYPDIYLEHDRFLSASTVEGGPIPLLEAMASGLVPVTSNTGFAPDVVRHGENGFLFDAAATIDDIVEFLESTVTEPARIQAAVAECTWQGYSMRAAKLIRGGEPT